MNDTKTNTETTGKTKKDERDMETKRIWKRRTKVVRPQPCAHLAFRIHRIVISTQDKPSYVSDFRAHRRKEETQRGARKKTQRKRIPGRLVSL